MVEHAGAGNIIVTHLKQSEIDKLPEQFKNDLECTTQSIDTMNLDKSRILLLDPSAYPFSIITFIYFDCLFNNTL